MRIAILDPQTFRGEHYRTMLALADYRCHLFSRAAHLLSRTVLDTYDCVVITGMTPDTRLTEAIQTLSLRAKPVPVLVVLPESTNHTSSTGDMVDLLNIGADDCLSEPFGQTLLLARIAALIRRCRRPQFGDKGETRFDDYIFDLGRNIVAFGTEKVLLTPRELSLALLLFRNTGREMSRPYLIDSIWLHESASTSRSLDTHLSRIRHKLRLSPERGYQLVALYGYGYRLDRFRQDAMPIALDLACQTRSSAQRPSAAALEAS